MDTTPRILIVDDDAELRRLTGEFLTRHGFFIALAANAVEMDRQLLVEKPDLIVLDLMMPGEHGLSVCRRMADTKIPIIVLSAMGEETDRVVGLELGADDYLPKPCSPRELLARVRAVLRRSESNQHASQTSSGQIASNEVATFAGWRLNMSNRELRAPEDVLVNLSGGEFTLLRAFLDHPQRILTRDQLLDYARGRETYAYDRAIDTQVSRLRKKLESYQRGIDLIKTVRNEGYIFTPPVRRE